MGAHTLGGASPLNSGYRGLWVEDGPTAFDQDYYTLMIDPSYTWTPEVSGLIVFNLLQARELHNELSPSTCNQELV